MICSRAICLRTFKIRDTQVVSHLFTKEEGLVPFVMSRPRSARSPLRTSLLSPLALLEVEWAPRPKSSLQRPNALRLRSPYLSIPYDPIKGAQAQFISEFLYYALSGERHEEALFDYLEKSFLWLDAAKKGVANFHLALLMRLSLFLGFYPNIEREKGDLFFDLKEGHFTSLLPDGGNFLPPKEAALLPQLLRMHVENIHLFSFSRRERGALLKLIITFYRLHLPSFPQLKSLQVLEDIFA